MLKYLRSNKKIVLAGLMILSMLTFVVNRGSGNGGNGAADREMGTIGGKTVYSSEMVESRAELSALRNNLSFSEEDRDPTARSFRELITMMAQKPELFFLLRHEARALGVQVNSDDVLSMMVNHAPGVQPDTDNYDITRDGVTDLLKVIARFEQVSGAIKVSKPMVNRALVEEHETIQANLIQLNAQDYLAKVPAPTTQQVQDQFNQFADSTPHQPRPTTNPFGFGYKLPMRSKLQYLRLSTDAAAAAVIATKTAYDWEVAANKYYLLNGSEFIPKPATTAPATLPAVVPPFAIVHDQVLQKIRQPLVTMLMGQIQSFVSSTLNTDYQNYSKSISSSTTAAAEADSSLGVRYSSFTYLSKLIDAVKTKFNVTMTAAESPAYLSDDQIGTIPGVGSAALTSYITKEATSYLAQVDAKSPTAASLLLRPSLPLQSSEPSNSVSFVRLTDALPSQRPATQDQVLSSVQADVRIASAYKLAQTNAAMLLTAAKTGTLLAVAQQTNHPIISLDSDSPLSMDSNDIKGVYPPLGDSASSFMNQAFQLLATYEPRQNPHPALTIEIPEQTRLFVAQATFVNATWNSESYFAYAFRASNTAGSMQQRLLANSWFDYDTTSQRLGFQSAKSTRSAS